MRACRTCLTKKDLNPLFGDLSTVRFTSKQLYFATGVQIRPNDNLPQVACKSCIKQIKKTLDFRYISIKTNQYLREILKKVMIKPKIVNNPDWLEDECIDRYFENTVLNNMFVEVKIEHDYLQDSNIDNSQFDNRQTNLENKQNNNSHFDNQINYDRNDKSEPDNGDKYLHNEQSDNYCIDNDRNCNSQSDNYTKSLDNHNSQLDKHLTIDNKLNADKINTKQHAKRAKRYKTKQIQTIKKKIMDRKLKIQDSCIDLSQKTKNTIGDFETDSGNSDISNSSSNQLDKDMKVKDICEENENFDDGIKFLGNKLISEESMTDKTKIDMCKQKRNKLMSLALTPYPPEGPVQCRVCHEYVKLTSFVMHAKRHFAPEFTCEECGKTFRSNAHMVYHQQRMHGREKRLACSLCDFRTVDRLKLKNHERGHSGERPYVCNECGSSFRMRTNIVQHMRTHFGVRNVQCEFCANMFRSRSELANHKNKVHNKMTYLCYLCPQTYKGKRAVLRHLINLHGIKEDQLMKIKCIKSKKFEEVPKT